ncbi:MAG: hypothetical protein H6918_11675 [Sphingomonadaceae bacterium]|nr:hypothetical protein [Sphingomonadaceae bacterium]
MPGLRAPAFLRAALALALAGSGLALPASVQAQQPAAPAVQPPPSVRPVPDQLELSKMIWSTMLAVDHANRSGNYSVLRDMSAQGFQINNNAARLAEIFAGIRTSRIDLSNALLVPPTYTEPPRQIQADVFQVKGIFQLRPTSIYFDMYYQWEQGRWKLFGIDIQPVSMVEAMPGPAPAPQQDRRRDRR